MTDPEKTSFLTRLFDGDAHVAPVARICAGLAQNEFPEFAYRPAAFGNGHEMGGPDGSEARSGPAKQGLDDLDAQSLRAHLRLIDDMELASSEAC